MICCEAEPAGGRLTAPPRPPAPAGLLAAATELALLGVRASLPLSVDVVRVSMSACPSGAARLLGAVGEASSCCCITTTDPGDRKYMGSTQHPPACTVADNLVQAGGAKSAGHALENKYYHYKRASKLGSLWTAPKQ